MSGITAVFCIKLLVTFVGGFLRVFRLPAPIKLTATMPRKYF
jgi:hypothetical protein